jgi:hypothetical protein
MGKTVESKFNQKTILEVTSIEECLDVVVSWVGEVYGKSFFVAPLEEFQNKYGKVNPEDDFYQARMNYFIEWCVLERPIKGDQPLNVLVSEFFRTFRQELASCSGDASHFWQSFASFKHGVYQICNSTDQMIEVQDLCLGGKFKVVSKAGETMKYLRKKMIFQGFIFGLHDRRYLGQGIIIHPELAESQLHKYFKQHRRLPRLSPHEIARVMASTNMRYLRMQHVNPAVIYQSISG